MIWALIAALLLDAALGEPRWLWDRLPHPAVVMGRAVGWADAHLNAGPYRRALGVLAIGGLVVMAGALGYALAALPGYLAEVIIGAMLLAQRSLTEHVGQVGDALELSLGDGRLAVSNIVSRDTAAMDRAQIARSAIESGAENLSDGVVAPALWFAVGGLPGLLIYKITNTADSMIGYRTERHAAFGWAAARLDDLLNLVPARITALLIWSTQPSAATWHEISQDARQHRSPNAGWPEAAMARVLDVALAGPRSYGGQPRSFPFVNANGRHDIGADDIRACVRRLWQTWAIMLALLGVIALTAPLILPQ